MILNPLRRQAYEALLIRASPIALRAYPQAKATFLRIGFSKIHGRPIVETSDSGNHVQLIRVSVLTQDEVSTIDVVVDETIRLRTGIRERLCSVTIAVHEAPIGDSGRCRSVFRGMPITRSGMMAIMIPG